MKSIQIRSFFWSVFSCIPNECEEIIRIQFLTIWTIFTQCYMKTVVPESERNVEENMVERIIVIKVTDCLWQFYSKRVPFQLFFNKSCRSSYGFFVILIVATTAWKVFVFRVFLVRIISHLDWIRRKYRPEKLRIQTLPTQCPFQNLNILKARQINRVSVTECVCN